MKTLIIIISLCFSLSGTAQTQALKQLQLDIEKLAQLKMQLQYMYKGYSILANGYTNIKNQSLANFVLHKDFIDALSMISPAVKNDPAVRDILTMQAGIVSECNAAYKKVMQYGVFNASEIRSFTKAYAKILSESNSQVDALQIVLTPNKLQMNETERLEAIEKIKESVEEKLAAIRSLSVRANTLASFRMRSKKDNEFLRNQYGIVK
ncbi:MAG: TerB family tellurite resistance protein [Bacteroidota bacterium]